MTDTASAGSSALDAAARTGPENLLLTSLMVSMATWLALTVGLSGLFSGLGDAGDWIVLLLPWVPLALAAYTLWRVIASLPNGLKISGNRLRRHFIGWLIVAAFFLILAFLGDPLDPIVSVFGKSGDILVKFCEQHGVYWAAVSVVIADSAVRLAQVAVDVRAAGETVTEYGLAIAADLATPEPPLVTSAVVTALGVPGAAESDERIARRFLASQAIMLALRGVPGIYFHSLFGSQNWREGVQQTGRNRTINRQKFQRETLEKELAGGLRQHVFAGYSHLLRLRTSEKAFHPIGEQKILNLHPAVFAVLRSHQQEALLCLHNVSAQAITLDLPLTGRDLVTGTAVPAQLSLAPYQVAWIKPS